MLFLFLILSFLYSGIDSVKKYEKLPPIDWNKGGLVFESDIKLEEFLKKNKCYYCRRYHYYWGIYRRAY